MSTGAARVEGYRRALQAAGLAHDPVLERLGPPISAFGDASCRALLAEPQPPTAVLTASVHITEGIIATVENLRLEVPRQLSIVGFGGSPWFSWWRGGLTAVVPPDP